MKRLAYEKDGNVNIVIPSESYKAFMMSDDEKTGRKAMSEKEFYEHLKEKDCSSETVIEVTEKQIPDMYFRDAFKINGKKLDIDMDKARGLHMDKIRKKRNKKLAELDIETLKGVDVQAEKQALRDIPETFDLSKAKTPAALKKLMPRGL